MCFDPQLPLSPAIDFAAALRQSRSPFPCSWRESLLASHASIRVPDSELPLKTIRRLFAGCNRLAVSTVPAISNRNATPVTFGWHVRSFRNLRRSRAKHDGNIGKDGFTVLERELQRRHVDGHDQIRRLGRIFGLEQLNPATQVIGIFMPHQVQVLDLDIERLVKSSRQRAANSAIPIRVDGRERAMRVQDDDLLRYAVAAPGHYTERPMTTQGK